MVFAFPNSKHTRDNICFTYFNTFSCKVVSFTNGSGPDGYTTLSPSLYESVRGNTDATNALPFLAGSKQIVARRYYDAVLAMASFDPTVAILVLISVLITGVMAGLFVPRLPRDIPRRGFDLLSWLAVLYGDGLAEQLPKDVRGGGMGERVDVLDVKDRVGEIKLRYTFRDFEEVHS